MTKYPMLIYPSKVRDQLFSNVFPTYYYNTQPLKPQFKKFSYSLGAKTLIDILALLGGLLFLAGLVTLINGDDGALMQIGGGLIMAYIFYMIGEGRTKHAKTIYEENMQKQKKYENDLRAFENAKVQHERMKSIKEDPIRNHAYRNKLVDDYFKDTRTNRKVRKAPLDSQLRFDTLSQYRKALKEKFASNAEIMEISLKDGSWYTPFLCLNFPSRNITTIIDIDDPHLIYSEAEVFPVELGIEFINFHADNQRRKEFYKDLKLKNSELIKLGFIIIKFSKSQITSDIEKVASTISSMLEYLQITDTTILSKTLIGNSYSNVYDFRENIFTF